MGLSEMQRARASRAFRGAPDLLRQGDDAGVHQPEGRTADDVFRMVEDAIDEYGRASFNAGRADATEYVRVELYAESYKDKLLDLLLPIIYREEK